MKKVFPSNKVYSAKSKIINSERGVFAKANIKKGEVIEICPVILAPTGDFSNLNKSILVEYFFYFGKKKDRMAIALGMGSLYNHSENPNARYKLNAKDATITFSAIKNIKKDSEISFNYKQSNPKSKNPLWFEID